MNLRPLVSLFVASFFLVLSGSGLLLYLLKHSNTTAAIHTSFGFVFLVVAGFHIRNNWKSLKTYSYKSGEGPRAFFKKELAITIPLAALLFAGLFYEVPGFTFPYDFGNELRLKQENKEEERKIYQLISTNQPGKGPSIEIDVKKGKAFEYPLFAVWTEDTDGRFLETLYVSQVIGTSRFHDGKEIDGKFVADVVRRPEALPYWGHQRGIKAKDGYFVPDPDTPVPDVVSAATPTENFKLRTRTEGPITKFRLYLEVNQSFDFNDYYSKTRFPGDAIYNGSGQNGQPSVIYAATIDLEQNLQYYALNVVGHGHHSGQDGTLYADLANLTTALDIVDGVMAKIQR